MRVLPPRSPLTQVGVFFGLLLIGPVAGLRLAVALAPESEVLQVAGVLSFALTFLGGMVLWLGVGVVSVVLRALWRLMRLRAPRIEGLGPAETLVPPGYGAFVALGILFGGGTGVLAWLVTSASFGAALGVWTGAGGAYGLLLRLAAHHGWLPFPEPE